MSQQGKRLAIIAVGVVAIVVAFVIASSGGDDNNRTGPSSAAATTTTGGSGGSAEPPRPAVQVIRVKDAKPVGGVQRIEARKGDRVRFKVVSDTADEVHVHGYDLHRDVEAGGSVSFSFPAKIDGIFDIELESRGEQIAELEVRD
ncbi:MAG: hypothetical protein IRZ21_04655 [Thermoleophilaceae bacterium]|nr:hypothetical protein [Thermoleophilaceae bacterium]